MSIRSSLSIKRLDKAEIKTPIRTKINRARLTKKALIHNNSNAVTSTPTVSPKTKKTTPTKSATTKTAAPKNTNSKKTPMKKGSATKTTASPKRKTIPAKAPAKKIPARKPATKKTSKTSKTSQNKLQPKTSKKSESSLKRNPLGHLLLEKQLRSVGFHGGISSDKYFLDSYATDESIFSIRPQMVIQPKTVEDIKTAVTLIATETKRFSSLSLTPRGAGTGLTGGSLTDSIVIDTSAHLNNILDVTHHKEDVFITCEPGVRWRDLEKRLKHIGYHLPIDLTSRDICTVGGAVGNNAAGAETTDYNHLADWIEKLDIVLHDGSVHTITPLTYKQFRTVTKTKNTYTALLNSIFSLIEKNEKDIRQAQPKQNNNTSGYPLWAVCPEGLAKWKKGTGTFSLIPLIAGSQGSLGIVSSITLRAVSRPRHTTLIAVPLFSLEDAHKVIDKAAGFAPLSMEVFDNVTFDLALEHPDFFKRFQSGLPYYRSVLSMYTNYHVRFGRTTPILTLLITLNDETTLKYPAREIAESISVKNGKARVITMPHEETMLQNIARSSYTLLKLRADGRRPAAFLEDMFIPHANIPKFLTQAKKLFSDFGVTVTLYGHAGKGHFQFYPLLDFKQKTTPALITKLSAQYLALAEKHGGTVCSELNDGILRTSQMNKLWSKKTLTLFTQLENIFDPDDIFNPGKKVNPRFDIKKNIRKSN